MTNTLSIGRRIHRLDCPVKGTATALTAAGGQLVLHATAKGIPTGHPIIPVMKVTRNKSTDKVLLLEIDLSVQETTATEKYTGLRDTLDGSPTGAESNGLREFAIAQIDSSV